MTRRRKILRITDALLVQMLGEGNVLSLAVVKDGLPPDALIVDARYNGFHPYGTLEILVESGEFPEIAEGSVYPEIMPMLESRRHA